MQVWDIYLPQLQTEKWKLQEFSSGFKFLEFRLSNVTWARAENKAGKTVDQAEKEYKLPAKYKGYVVTVNPQFASLKGNLQIVYDELKK